MPPKEIIGGRDISDHRVKLYNSEAPVPSSTRARCIVSTEQPKPCGKVIPPGGSQLGRHNVNDLENDARELLAENGINLSDKVIPIKDIDSLTTRIADGKISSISESRQNSMIITIKRLVDRSRGDAIRS